MKKLVLITLVLALGLTTVNVATADTWTQKADMPTARFACAASVVNGKIYVIGGEQVHNDPTPFTVVEVYDPATDTWERKADMPTGREGLATAVVDGKIYAIGGQRGAHVMVSTVEVYDPATDSWEKKTDMPTARQICAVGMVDGKIYVIGGKSGVLCFSTVEEYDAIPPLVVDFNGDGKVDCADMCMMVEHWGENYQLCDIAPKPFGDGIVDVQDLIVLAEHLFEDYRLIANWELDETEGSIAHDSTGNNNANIVGDPVWQPVDGMYYGALEFDGIDDYMSTPFILDPMKGSLSAFAWIKGGAPGQVIISQTGNFGGTWLGINSSEGKLMTGFSDMYFGALVSETVIIDGQWHHVGLVYDLDTLHRRLYVDGALVAEDAMIVSGMPSDGGLYIGADKTLAAGTFFSGLIDDVRIYTVALTTEEIVNLSK